MKLTNLLIGAQMTKKKIKGSMLIEICVYALFMLLMIKAGNYIYNVYQSSRFNLVISEIRMNQMHLLFEDFEKIKLTCGAIIKKLDNEIVISDENDLGFFSLVEANKIKNNIDNIAIEESENGKYLILIK